VDFLVAALVGFVSGFVGSMPVAGPMAVMVLERAVRGDHRNGFFFALGGALAEGLVALTIALVFPLLYTGAQLVIVVSRGLGAVAITSVGVLLIARPSSIDRTRTRARGSSFLTGLAVAGLNPTLIATWLVVLATLYGNGWLPARAWAAPAFALGVSTGISTWFGIVLLLGNRLKTLLTERGRSHFVRVMGVVLVGAGVYLGIRFVLALIEPKAQRAAVTMCVPGPSATYSVPPTSDV
jgi:threonine/homoserine/homoserine lactone efflux protein